MATIPADPAVKDPTKASLPATQNAALAEHEGFVNSVRGLTGAVNGSYEVSAASQPSSWTQTVNGGSPSGAIETSNVHHGKQSLSLVINGASDDIQYESDDYIPVALGQRVFVEAFIEATIASGIDVDIDVMWYHWNGSAFEAASTVSSSAYSSLTNPTTYARRLGAPAAPSGAIPATYYRIRVKVAYNSATGTVVVDGLSSHIYRGFVPITLTSKTFGATVTLSLNDANEHPIAGWFYVESVAAANIVASGFDQLTNQSISVFTAGMDQDNAILLRVPVDDSAQCLITQVAGRLLWQVGYEV